MTEDEYNQMTVVDIRAEFKKRGIPTTGLSKKAQLIRRLLDDDAEAGKPAEEEKEEEQPKEEEPLAPEAPAAVSAVAPLIPEPAEAVEPAAIIEPADPAPAPATDDNVITNAATDPVSSPPEVVPAPVLTESTPLAEPVIEEPPTAAAPLIEPIPAPLPPEARPEEILEPAPAPVAPTIDSFAATPPIITTTNQMEKRDSFDMSRTPDATAPVQGVITDAVPVAAVEEDQDTPMLEGDSTDESRKRKRRSETPPLSAEEIAQKKLKQDHDNAGAVHLQEDVAPPPLPTHPEEPINEIGAKDGFGDQTSTLQSEGAMSDPPMAPVAEPAFKDQRYKDLFTLPDPAASEKQQDVDVTDTEERAIAPAVHPATAALYVRNFKRPLQPAALKEHLISIAHPPQGANVKEDSTEVLKQYHLDGLRTHCFALFSSLTAAARARTALHDHIWPSEKEREPLWADFIPEIKVQEWIDTELNAGGGGRGAGMRRWEVVYDTESDGSVHASLQEASTGGTGPRRPAPTSANGISRSNTDRDMANVPPPVKQPAAASFVALDQLFKSTTAKPKLYFLPVEKGLVDKRLDELDKTMSRRISIPPGGSGYPDSRRWTFEEGDMLVDNGPEYGLGPPPRPPRNTYGGRGGYGPGRYRGGW